MAVRTLPDLLRHALEAHNKSDAFLVRREGAWHPISMTTVMERAGAVMAALRARGVAAGDRVVILAESRIEWALADMAIVSLGAVTVPIYPTLPAVQIAPLLVDCGCVGAFASSKEQREKLESVRAQAPALRWIWCFDEEPLPESGAGEGRQPGGAGAGTAAAAGGPNPDDLASIIYTSGTTGIPKGVMLTHANVVAEAVLSLDAMALETTDAYLSFLPLSHIFERCNGLYTMLYAGATIAYSESLDRVAANLLEVRPTIIMAVPRFYEKLLDRATDASDAAGFPKRQMFRWGRKVAVEWARLRDERRSIPLSLALQHAIAGILVYSKLAHRLGGRVRLRVSGGAPLNREVALFFAGAGQAIHEGYGLTETSSAICVNRFENHRIGTVGPVFDKVEVRIAEDGEILVRSPLIMKGYWNRPEETAAALKDGWFHTGDIGAVDPDGHLRITDRKKDLIVTSGGKKVAPQIVEAALKSSPRIQEAVVLGEGKKYIGALIVPSEGATREEVAAEVNRANATLAQFEQVKKFELIPNDLTVENGYLTPSLKVKRRAVADRYRELIERLFVGA